MSWVGSTVAGKYLVTGHIGSGGMGTVVAARHVHLDSPVALKFLSDTSETSVKRFLREAKASAAIKSEHVCRVSDFGVERISELGHSREVPYLAMELLEGRDLAAILRDNGALPVATAVDFVLQACMGVAEAHALGIVHRDLKPGNLFLTQRTDGSPLVKVLDFGIAKVPVLGNVSLTSTTNVVGSPAYMSPEQLRSSRSVDARSDVWALGVILYELVSNRHPFVGESLTELAVSISVEAYRPLVEAPELDAVVRRCLAKEAERRFADVASLAETLTPFSGSRKDVAAVTSRILYGDHDRATVPRPAERPEISTAGTPTQRADKSSTTIGASTGQITRPTAKGRGLAILGGVALAFLAGGVAFYVINQPADKPVIATAPVPVPVREVPADAAPVITPIVDAAPATGILIVRVTGAKDATIVIDNVEIGTAEKVERDLPPGEHVVELRARGRDPIQQTVDVRAGTVSTVAIVIPAAPNAKPVFAVKASKPIVRRAEKPKPDLMEPGGLKTEKTEKTEKTDNTDKDNELLEPTKPAWKCPIIDRLPGGGCATKPPPVPAE